MLTYVSYYIPSNQSNGFRRTLKRFTELRAKQVIQTIPSLELCCGSADSFWEVESLTLLVVMHFTEYLFREPCLFISLYLYLLFLNWHNNIKCILRLLQNMAASVDLTFVFCSHVQTSAAKLIKTYSFLWGSEFHHPIILSTTLTVSVSVQNWQKGICTSE